MIFAVEYKVVRGLSLFGPNAMERALNRNGAEGWKLCACLGRDADNMLWVFRRRRFRWALWWSTSRWISERALYAPKAQKK